MSEIKANTSPGPFAVGHWRQIVDAEGKAIAQVRARKNVENIHLLAASADMLSALEDAEFLLRKAGQIAGPMQDSFNRSAADARAAIAKAKGN